MKIKTLLISLTVCAALAGGGVYAAYHFAASQKQPVEVVPVENVNIVSQMAMYGMDDTDMFYGTVISKGTQTVELRSDLNLKEVLVKEGDKVKVGDVLMTYDMTMKELLYEQAQLQLQLQEISLRQAERKLETIRAKNPSLFIGMETEQYKTTSAGLIIDAISSQEGDESALPIGVDTSVELVDPEGDRVSGDLTVSKNEAAESVAEDDRQKTTIGLIEAEDSKENSEENSLIEDENAKKSVDLIEPEDEEELEAVFSDDELEEIETEDSTESMNGLIEEEKTNDQQENAQGGALFGVEPEVSLGESEMIGSITLSSDEPLMIETEREEESEISNNSVPKAVDDFFLIDTEREEESEINNNPAPQATDELFLIDIEREETEIDDIHDSGGDDDLFVIESEKEEDIYLDETDAGSLIEEEDPADSTDDESSEDNTVTDDKPDHTDNGSDEAGEVIPEEDLKETENLEDLDDDNGIDFNLRETEEVQTPSAEQKNPASQTIDLSDDRTDSAKTMRDLTDFFSLTNLLASQYSANGTVTEQWLTEAEGVFTTKLGTIVKNVNLTNAFGEKQTVAVYGLSSSTYRDLQELEEEYGSVFNARTTVTQLYEAYAKICSYRLIYNLNQMYAAIPQESSVDQLTQSQAKKIETQIRNAVNAYYALYFYWKYLTEDLAEAAAQDPDGMIEALPQLFTEDLESMLRQYALGSSSDSAAGASKFDDYPVLGKGYKGDLSKVIAALKKKNVIEQEPEYESVDDNDETDYWGDGDFDDGYDYDDSETPEELKQTFFDYMMDVRDQKLSVREAEQKVKELKQELDEGTVKATINGVVTEAGTVNVGATGDAFIIVSGQKGMYAVGRISELKRDTIKIGDMITGTSEENGVSFTAEITEISDYPNAEDDSSGYYFYSSGTENTNVSYYAFYAYIEDPGDLCEGSAQMSFVTDSAVGGNVCLEDYFISTEDSGKKFVYIVGDDGKLKKQYVKVSSSPYGWGTMIDSGVNTSDYIALPFGKNVTDGAQVKKVDSLEEDYDY